MKLHSLTTLNAIDPLPKLGKKVESKTFDVDGVIAGIKRLAFEQMPHECARTIIKPFSAESNAAFGSAVGANYTPALKKYAQPAHDGTGYIDPEPSVSFADAAEMADGWIKWGGGECPVPVGAKVDIRFRDNSEYLNEDADGLHWRNHGDGWNTDIIAYRVIKPAAEVVEKKAVTYQDVLDAAHAAEARIGMGAWKVMVDARKRAGAESGEFGNAEYASHWPAAIAALEALR